MKKWANKSRGLRYYAKGKDVYGAPFTVSDGSWACFAGVRIYGKNSSNEQEDICLSLKVKDAQKLAKGLLDFVKQQSVTP